MIGGIGIGSRGDRDMRSHGSVEPVVTHVGATGEACLLNGLLERERAGLEAL